MQSFTIFSAEENQQFFQQEGESNFLNAQYYQEIGFALLLTKNKTRYIYKKAADALHQAIDLFKRANYYFIKASNTSSALTAEETRYARLKQLFSLYSDFFAQISLKKVAITADFMDTLTTMHACYIQLFNELSVLSKDNTETKNKYQHQLIHNFIFIADFYENETLLAKPNEILGCIATSIIFYLKTIFSEMDNSVVKYRIASIAKKKLLASCLNYIHQYKQTIKDTSASQYNVDTSAFIKATNIINKYINCSEVFKIKHNLEDIQIFLLLSKFYYYIMSHCHLQLTHDPVTKSEAANKCQMIYQSILNSHELLKDLSAHKYKNELINSPHSFQIQKEIQDIKTILLKLPLSKKFKNQTLWYIENIFNHSLQKELSFKTHTAAITRSSPLHNKLPAIQSKINVSEESTILASSKKPTI
jgi:hypothetical protein